MESLFNKAAALQACNVTKKRPQHRCFPVNIAKFKNTYFEKHLRTAASDSSYILHRKLNKIIQELIILFLLKHKITLFYGLLFVFIRFITRRHSLSLIFVLCNSLSVVVIRCHFFTTCCPSLHWLHHSLSLAVIRCTTHCHSLYHSLSLVVTRCYLLSLDVPLVCLFINDRKHQ